MFSQSSPLSLLAACTFLYIMSMLLVQLMTGQSIVHAWISECMNQSLMKLCIIQLGMHESLIQECRNQCMHESLNYESFIYECGNDLILNAWIVQYRMKLPFFRLLSLPWNLMTSLSHVLITDQCVNTDILIITNRNRWIIIRMTHHPLHRQSISTMYHCTYHTLQWMKLLSHWVTNKLMYFTVNACILNASL